MRKCKHCGSEFVCWNWFVCPFWGTWKRNFWYNGSFPYFRWKFWRFLDRWHGECWECSSITSSFFKVWNGIPNDVLHKTFVHLPKHNIKEIESLLWHSVSQGIHYADKPHDRRVWARRKKMVVDLVKETFDKQWELDHEIKKPIPPPNKLFKESEAESRNDNS